MYNLFVCCLWVNSRRHNKWMHCRQTSNACYKLHVIELLTCQPTTYTGHIYQLLINFRCMSSVVSSDALANLFIELDWMQLPNQGQEPNQLYHTHLLCIYMYLYSCTILYLASKCSDLPCFVSIRSLLDILGRLMRFLMPFHTAREHLSFECCMIMLAKRFEPNFD